VAGGGLVPFPSAVRPVLWVALHGAINSVTIIALMRCVLIAIVVVAMEHMSAGSRTPPGVFRARLLVLLAVA
jgi:hypothetical protein